MADIRSLPTPSRQANEEAVATLREWLAMAERGEITAVALAGLHPDNSSITTATSGSWFHGLLAAVTILQHRMLATHTG